MPAGQMLGQHHDSAERHLARLEIIDDFRDLQRSPGGADAFECGVGRIAQALAAVAKQRCVAHVDVNALALHDREVRHDDGGRLSLAANPRIQAGSDVC